MNLFGIEINSANDEKANWVIELTAPKVTLTLAQARDLAMVIRDVSLDPEALHREPLVEEPTFCEGGKAR